MRKFLFIALALFCGLALLVTFALPPAQKEFLRRAQLALQDVSGNVCAEAEVNASSAAPAIVMRDAAQLLGLPVQTQSFSLAVSDLDGDERDDILIGTHGQAPLLYLNQPGQFVNASSVLSGHYGSYDSHGHTLADFDGDGDLDIAVAGGGADGVGPGSPNILLKQGSTNGSMLFSKETMSAGFALKPSRTRSLMPLSSPNGGAVDLYLTTLLRREFPNTLLRNGSTSGDISFSSGTNSALTKNINDRGRGVLADFNGNGSVDYLAVTGNIARLHWDGSLTAGATDLASRVYTAVAGDFNNDGALDIFLGRYSPPTNTDLITHTADGWIFAVYNSEDDDVDSASFTTESDSIALNLRQKVRLTDSGAPRGIDDIFIGQNSERPKNRTFGLNKSQAAGKPHAMEQPGTYIWHTVKNNKWYVRWVHRPGTPVYKGLIEGVGVDGVTTRNLEHDLQRATRDLVLINDGRGRFTRLCVPSLEHQEITAHATVADFNLDGWLDIIALRRGEHGAGNGDILVLSNQRGQAFTLQKIAPRQQDILQAADLIAHGFFNTDALPDIVISNGYGQIPGNNGEPRLLLNDSPVQQGGILVQLLGSNANSFAVGARLALRDANNALAGYRVQGLNTNISQDSYRQHFGLGQYKAPYTLIVAWPDGSSTEHVLPGSGSYSVAQPVPRPGRGDPVAARKQGAQGKP